MATKKNKEAPSNIDLDFAFFNYLRLFYIEKKGTIRNHYRDLTKKFLDFNDPSNVNSFLRVPQFEALEMYIFLKEYLNNAQMHQIFEDWYFKKERFVNRYDVGLEGEQMILFGTLNEKEYKSVFNKMKQNLYTYSNYIFALTMGTGKTILMATCIFYEFILANKFPKDMKYCHNAIIFAPDKTVLESLREIFTFDKSLVVPPEYVAFLDAHLKTFFLDETGATLDTIDRSKFNIIISNTQKVILKRQHKEKTAVDKMFSSQVVFEEGSVYAQAADLYDFDTPEDDSDLTVNQRFSKLTRLEQLGVYVDEAHHAFGDKLAKDLGYKKDEKSLRLTINELALYLKRAGTRVVACYNFTGTPYIGNNILPEVVYSYGLKQAIDNEYLKQVDLHGFSNTKSEEFVKLVVKDFWGKYGENRYEGLLPKIAFFAATIEELQNELKPALDIALNEMGIPLNKILINIGNSENDAIREFNSLDRQTSEKQFILLVNKGREGWNCRSLFGVALFRKPKSKVFVLQATMRCMRAITNIQQTASVYLSNDNYKILQDELQQNFRLGTGDLGGKKSNKGEYVVKIVPPPVKIPLKRVKREHFLNKKVPRNGVYLELDKIDTEKYKLEHIITHGLEQNDALNKEVMDITHLREKRVYSSLTLVAEISRYLNRSCIEIEDILLNTVEGLDSILDFVNNYNEILFDWIIPRLFSELFDITIKETVFEEEIELVKTSAEKDSYVVISKPDLVVSQDEFVINEYYKKSFHLDKYCFDSMPEKNFFWDNIQNGKVKKIYFTGMLTHGQTEFFVQYIDPESHTVRKYYPDFLVQKDDESWVIIEIKGDNKIDDPVVKAKKEYANHIALINKMNYQLIKESDVNSKNYDLIYE